MPIKVGQWLGISFPLATSVCRSDIHDLLKPTLAKNTGFCNLFELASIEVLETPNVDSRDHGEFFIQYSHLPISWHLASN